ncbi:HNH endonuclease [Myroides odoratimimus]|uniref:HNH endonuclease n=1 Tax=Myroides odoratimimus TaxID=76832 RepID=UPI00310141FA
MKNLKKPTVDCFDEFEKIRESKLIKTRDELKLIKTQVSDRYREYDREFLSNSLENISNSTFVNDDKANLIGCYSKKTKALNTLILNIREAQVGNICQYCGIDSDDSIDHYLPKEDFSEFSVKPLNLIPCCLRCNQLKEQYWKNKKTLKRGIINLYLDDICLDQYLFMNLKFEPTSKVFSAEFYLENRTSIDTNLFDIISSHYKKLDLLDRYRKKFNSVYTSTLSSFRKNSDYLGKPSKIKGFLLNETEALAEDLGSNNYKVVIKKALASNNTFLNQIK